MTTSERVTGVLDETIAEGMGPRAAAKLIRERLGETVFSKERANAIARTETTGAMNAGHQAGYEQLEAGLIAGKTWDTIPDKDLRETHAETHGQTVKVRDSFKVPLPSPGSGRRRRKKDLGAGFELAPWPGHWGLSAANRVNCRCTTLAAFDPAMLDGKGLR